MAPLFPKGACKVFFRSSSSNDRAASRRSSQQLSQTDIDRMMRARPEASVRPSSTDVQIYDFRRPHRVSTERLRTLEAMYGRLVKSFEGWLMGRVRGVVDLRSHSVEQISFGEYVLSLPRELQLVHPRHQGSGGRRRRR